MLFSHILTGKRSATIVVITPKIYKAELWFLCMAHRHIVLYNCMKVHLNSFNGYQLTERTCRLIVLYNCMKFHFDSFNGCQLTVRTRNSIANDKREITQNYPKQSKVMVLVHNTLSHCALQVHKV